MRRRLVGVLACLAAFAVACGDDSPATVDAEAVAALPQYDVAREVPATDGALQPCDLEQGGWSVPSFDVAACTVEVGLFATIDVSDDGRLAVVRFGVLEASDNGYLSETWTRQLVTGDDDTDDPFNLIDPIWEAGGYPADVICVLTVEEIYRRVGAVLSYPADALCEPSGSVPEAIPGAAADRDGDAADPAPPPTLPDGLVFSSAEESVRHALREIASGIAPAAIGNLDGLAADDLESFGDIDRFADEPLRCAIDRCTVPYDGTTATVWTVGDAFLVLRVVDGGQLPVEDLGIVPGPLLADALPVASLALADDIWSVPVAELAGWVESPNTFAPLWVLGVDAASNSIDLVRGYDSGFEAFVIRSGEVIESGGLGNAAFQLLEDYYGDAPQLVHAGEAWTTPSTPVFGVDAWEERTWQSDLAWRRPNADALDLPFAFGSYDWSQVVPGNVALSGCTPGDPDRLPDGLWAGYVDTWMTVAQPELVFDLVCYRLGSEIGFESWEIENSNPGLQTLPLDPDVRASNGYVTNPDESAISPFDLADFERERAPLLTVIAINGGRITEITIPFRS